MNQPLTPPVATLVPETAPFTTEQRLWLNGFFAGLVSLDGAGVTALSPEQGAALMPQPGDADDDDAPWHDQTIALADRMQLAEGRPLKGRLMAAMAQQDCGQCGYNCRDYSTAIFDRKEARLNLCVPGGKETARMLKKLHEELDAAPPAAAPAGIAPGESSPAASPTAGNAAAATQPGRSRDNPVPVAFHACYLLSKPGSEKRTHHIEFDLLEAGLDYVVGDSFGLFPANDPALVDAILAAIEAPADYRVGDRALRDVLLHDVSLSPAPDSLFEFISWLTGGERRRKARALAAGEDPDGDAETLDVLAALEKFPGPRPDPEAFVEALEPLQPRLYSISSSPRVDPNRISLTVDTVRYAVGSRDRLGVASTFLGERVGAGDKVRAYVQRAHAFGLPADPAAPIIMVGPGTGVAPFRAFLQERMAAKAPGKNWLFFGHQRQACDFFYEDEFAGMKAAGVLTRLTLAWSRDGAEKIYVQTRMREEGAELWRWLNDGAHFYVCGDAMRMAKDVETALVDLIAEHGGKSKEDAAAYLMTMKKKGRFQADVY
jgi:sulfite reductase (NADPH) flavoprotein alpha-component